MSFLGCISLSPFCFRLFNASCNLFGIFSLVRKLIIVWFIAQRKYKSDRCKGDFSRILMFPAIRLSYLCHMLKTVLHEAIMAGGEQVSKYFNQTFEIKYKEGRNNLVTAADHASERAILEVIQKAYPDHYILTEETGELPQNSEYKWIIDPIDGTINFAHGIPLNCISIGVEFKGEMILGMVYNPHMNELFFAEKGEELPKWPADQGKCRNGCNEKLPGYGFSLYLYTAK